MSETSEKEAIQRFVEGCSAAADYMLQLQHIDRHPKSSAKFMKAIRDASGSAHQLAHMQQNPVFLEIRDQLEEMTRGAAGMAFANHVGKKPPMIGGQNMFVYCSDLLKAMCILGKKISSAKAMKREEVLFMIGEREKKAKVEDANTTNGNGSRGIIPATV